MAVASKLPEEDRPDIDPGIPNLSPHNESEDSGEAKQDSNALTPDDLKEAEEQGSDNSPFGYHEEGGKLSAILGGGKSGTVTGKISNKAKKRILLAGLPLALLFIIMIFLMNSLKVVHFGEVLTATGYARFNGILQERATQDIFDASTVNGEGSVDLTGRTLLDRLKMRNVESQISELGRNGEIKFSFNDSGAFDSVTTKSGTVSLDAISKDITGKNYSELNRVFDFRDIQSVKYEFTNQLQAAVSEDLSLEARYVQSRVFQIVSDNVGFKFYRWAQAARDFLGKSPEEALTQDTLNSVEEVSADQASKVGIGTIDEQIQQRKNADKLKAYLEKNGGEFDPVKFQNSLEADLAKSQEIADVANTAGGALIIASLACMTNAAFSKLPQIQQTNETEASREALQFAAAKDQVKSGDTTAEAVGATTQRLNGADNAPAYLASTGQPVQSDNPTNIPKIKPSFNSTFVNVVKQVSSPTRMGLDLATFGLNEFLRQIPFVGSTQDRIDRAFCDGLLSPAGASVAAAGSIIVQAVIGALSDGGGVAAEEGASVLATQIFLTNLKEAVFETAQGLISKESLGALAGFTAYDLGLNYVVGMLSGTTISGADTGANYYQQAAVGTNVMQSRQTRTLGGRPLNNSEAAGVDKQYTDALKTSYNKQGFFARYFSSKNPFSLAGMMSAKVPNNFASVSTMFDSLIYKIGSVFQMGSITNLFASTYGLKPAYAATTYDVYNGLQQWGFSPDELNKMEHDYSYSLADNENHITPKQITHYDSTIGKCFDPARSQTDVERDGDCTAAKLSSDSVLRYRIYLLDKYLVDDFSQDYAHPTASSAGVPNNKSVFLLGDSYGVGMRDYGDLGNKLTQHGYSLGADVACGRRLAGTDTFTSCDVPPLTVPEGLGAVDQQSDKDSIKSAGTVLITLGTNDLGGDVGAFKDNISSMIDKIRALNSSANIYWTNFYLTSDKQSSVAAFNTALSEEASSKNFTVIDWASQAPSDYSPGQIHPNDYNPLSDLVVQSVAK